MSDKHTTQLRIIATVEDMLPGNLLYMQLA